MLICYVWLREPFTLTSSITQWLINRGLKSSYYSDTQKRTISKLLELKHLPIPSNILSDILQIRLNPWYKTIHKYRYRKK
jgi:hypothetical protein